MGVINAFKRLVARAKPLNTDVNQYLDALSGNIDVGALALFQPIPLPSAPTVAVNTTSGVLNGNYKYIVVNVTGWVGSDGSYYVSGFAPSAASSVVAPANQQVNVSWSTGPSGTIGYVLYRTGAGGSTYKFLTWISDNTVTAYTDNTPDSSLGTGMPTSSSSPSVNGVSIPSTAPTVNTTGTNLKYLDNYSQYASNLGNNTIYTTVQYKRPDGTLYMESDLSNPDGNGNYQTDTWKFYDTDGTTLLSTHVWSLTWDNNGKITQKVMTS